jgi:hypothetical protein
MAVNAGSVPTFPAALTVARPHHTILPVDCRRKEGPPYDNNTNNTPGTPLALPYTFVVVDSIAAQQQR